MSAPSSHPSILASSMPSSQLSSNPSSQSRLVKAPPLPPTGPPQRSYILGQLCPLTGTQAATPTFILSLYLRDSPCSINVEQSNPESVLIRGAIVWILKIFRHIHTAHLTENSPWVRHWPSIPTQMPIKAHSSLRGQTCCHPEAREAVTGQESGAETRRPDFRT